MSRRVFFYFALTFLLGVVIGAAGMFLSGWYRVRQHGFNKERVIRRLSRELRLSEAQVQQLNQIVDDSEKKFSDLRAQVGSQFEALRKERQDRIRQILTPAQTAKFNEMVRRFEERMRKRRGP